MKKQNENICKFVTNSSGDGLVITNFVFEKNCPEYDKMLIKQKHTMYIAVSGVGRFKTEHVEEMLLPGTLFFSFAGIPYMIENVDEFNYMYITFSGQRAQELFRRFAVSTERCIFKGFENIVSFWQNCLGKATDKNLDLISESVLLHTFSEMSPPSEDSDEYLTGRIMKYIEDHFTESSLSLASLAEDIGYNPKYISRIFKDNIGFTFSEYIRNTRIQHSIFLIEQGVTAVKNLALLSGYRDPFYFSNVFRQVVGMSPSEFISRKIEK